MSKSSQNNVDPSTTPELVRAIRLPQATAMVVGIIIGSAIFQQPSEITGRIPTVGGIFLVWLVAGLLTFSGALVCAELSVIFPQNGGVYVFLRESFGRPLGFLWGWGMFWTVHTGIIAAIALVFARYANVFVALDDVGTRVVAIVVILVISGVNLLGVRSGSNLHALFTAGKLLAMTLIMGIGLAFGGSSSSALHVAGTSVSDLTPVSLHEFALALVAGLFAFGGWHMVTYSAGETVDPPTTIPRALAIGVAIVTWCYIALNFVYLHILPLEAVASSKRIAADAADAVLGVGGERIMAALVTFSTFGALSGIILTGPRVYYAMAQDGLMFRWFAKIDAVRRSPNRAIILQAGWACVLVAVDSYTTIYKRVIYTEWLFFGLMAIGLTRLRTHSGLPHSYSMWRHLFVPILFAIAAFGVSFNQIVSRPGESAIGLAIVLLGVPVYYFWTGRTLAEDTA